MAELGYQNPNSANITSTLDSRVVSYDPIVGLERRREVIEAAQVVDLLEEVSMRLRDVTRLLLEIVDRAPTLEQNDL